YAPWGELFNRSNTLEQRGRVARYRGENAKAREYFEAARTGFEKWLSPDNPERTPWHASYVMMYLAEINAALGRKEEALREGRKAVELRVFPEICHQALEIRELHRDPFLGADLAALLSIVYLWAGERDA